MPGFDTTGPTGAGPMTGGGRGRCASPSRSATESAGFNFGRGRRMGRAGMRRRQGFRGYDLEQADLGPKDDMQHLRQEAQLLEERLRQIQDRIDSQSQQSNE